MLLPWLAPDARAQIDETENRNLEAWLTEQGLDDLLLQQLETRLESTTNQAAREDVAKQLANLYAKRLISLDDDSQKLIKRTRELIAVYPRFETGRLRVAMLHARYLECEKLFRDLIRERSGEDDESNLESQILALEEDLTAALGALLRRSEDLLAAGQLMADRQSITAERQIVEAEAMHCQFLSGWTNYFLAMINEEQRSARLDQAETRFREFLQLDAQSLISDYDSRWFDFSSAWHVRAIVGLASITTARQDTSQAIHLFKLLRSNAVTRESREAVIRFQFLAHRYCGQFDEATRVLRDRGSITAMSRQGRVRLWATVLETPRTPKSSEMHRLAMLGLTRNMAGELLVRQYESSIPTKATPFESCWIAGYAEFWKSENGEPDAAVKARQFLQKADTLTENSDPNDVARCRYLLGWLMLKENEFEKAIEIFTDVAQQLADTDPQLASESSWMATKTSLRLSNADPGRINDAWNRLERFVRTWPDSPRASKASFEKLKIELRSMTPEKAIRKLNEFSPNDENYGAALLELVAQHYRTWQSQPENATALENLKAASLDVNSSLMTTAGQKLRSQFLVVDALLRIKSVPPGEIESILNQCSQELNRIEDSDLASAELSYYRMLFAQSQNNSQQIFKNASTILEHGTDTRFELPALIQMARHLDASVEDGGDIDPAIDLYKRLSQRVGTNDKQLMASRNSRVALSRLGELFHLAGDSVESERVFERLVGLFPGNVNYLRNLAIAKSGRDDEAAKIIWQKLATGSEAGSDLWFESKYELAAILAFSDKPSAVRLLKQTMQLGGDVPESWRESYESKIQQLSDEEL